MDDRSEYNHAPGLARQQLSFSVFERAQRLDVDAWLQRGPAVVAVPFEDKDALRDPAWW